MICVRNILKIAFVIFAFLINSKAFSACNFKTGDYINELNNPRFIESISIEVPKSGKFNKNFAKIISYAKDNIPPSLKKKFKAFVTINYEFGNCTFKARVRQSGDWKDHVGLNNMQPLRSLDVSLKEGNIMNAVKFKLLIPKTRFNNNEILGSLLLRELDFIAPETFHVVVDVNGSESLMLFQEKAEKELLERNMRREGPIFEGDEVLLWSYKNYENFLLEDISLARLTNPKWFNKGQNSERITLVAFQRLQKAYVEYVVRWISTNWLIIFPNQKNNDTFANYSLLLESMNGQHALRPHNRIFYFNSFSDNFEPIYYDGDLDLSKPLSLVTHEFYSFAQKSHVVSYLNSLNDPKFLKILKTKYLDRVKPRQSKDDFFKKSIQQVIINLKSLRDSSLNKLVSQKYKSLQDNERSQYLSNHKKHNLKQAIINKIIPSEIGYIIEIQNANNSEKSKKIVTPKQLSEILSKNKLENFRTIFLPINQVSKALGRSDTDLEKFKFLNGNVTFSKGILLEVIENDKIIRITQTKPTDWILFSNLNLKDWKINFQGAPVNYAYDLEQSFNDYGMTGCINFYNASLDGTSIQVNRGQCEDSLNIVKSKGKLNTIVIEFAFADALDIDFSEISINTMQINEAGNDCVDFSGGKYTISKADLTSCADKAISIGEKSNAFIKHSIIKNSQVGISVKDYSQLSSSSIDAIDVKICLEATQKKQEFGGAFAKISNFVCNGDFQNDFNSRIKKSNELS